MNILSIELGRLRHSEYIAYVQNCLNVFEENDPDILGFRAPFDALTAKIDAIEAIYKLNRASALTAVIADLDVQRDEALMSISFLIRAYMGHYDASKVQDAKTLNIHLNVYGGASGLAHESLPGETTSLDNLLFDLQNDAILQAAVASLNLTDWIGQLKIMNDNLKSAYQDRLEERSQASLDKVKNLRNEANDLYRNLMDFLFAKALLEAYAPPYDAVIRGVNAATEQYNNILAQRSGGGDKEEE